RRSCRLRSQTPAGPGAAEPDPAARRHRRPRLDAADVRTIGRPVKRPECGGTDGAARRGDQPATARLRLIIASRTRSDMWPSNPLTERLKLKFPIIQAPMGIIATPAMAAAVSNAGG